MSMVGLNASAHDIEVKNADGKTIYYNYINNSTELAVTYRGSSSSSYSNEYTGDVVIPESVTYSGKTYNVTSIGESSFSNCSNLTSITIPNSVTDIGNRAFEYCYGLSSISIPNSITSIGNGAFYVCSGLTNVTIGDKVTKIGNYAFFKCTNLTSIKIPNCVTSIGESAFGGCTELLSVTLSNNLKLINNGTFSGCSKLESIKIPNKVTSIGEQSFASCESLISIEIPNSVTSIGKSAFNSCYKLEKVSIGKNVANIGYSAFGWCRDVRSIYCYIESPISYSGFEYDTGASPFVLGTLYVLHGKSSTYSNAAGWKKFNNIVELNSKYTITYLVDGEEYKTKEEEVGATIILETVPIKEGYTFSGWSDIPETMPGYDIQTKGTFSINKYKLTYKVDGEEYKTYEVEYGSNITPETEPTKELYTFSGWSEIPETMPAHDVEINGTFSLNKYKLTYYVDGTEYKSYNIKYGSTLIPIDEPSKEGYTFSGWSEIPETMPANDVIVTGTFSVNKYKLTYFVDNEEYKSYDVEFGSTITPETEPSKEGYTFSGWSEIPETMPAQNVDVYGTYSKETEVNSIYTTDNSETKFFSLEGRQLSQPQKGLNILKMSDGTTRKVVK